MESAPSALQLDTEVFAELSLPENPVEKYRKYGATIERGYAS
jgi:hypothetical protein